MSMHFANAIDDFEIVKIIIVNLIIRILTNFIQRINKFYIFIIIINVFSLMQMKNATLIKI